MTFQYSIQYNINTSIYTITIQYRFIYQVKTTGLLSFYLNEFEIVHITS